MHPVYHAKITVSTKFAVLRGLGPRSLVFFRITGKKYFVLYRSQAINISYSTSQAAWFFRRWPPRPRRRLRWLVRGVAATTEDCLSALSVISECDGLGGQGPALFAWRVRRTSTQGGGHGPYGKLSSGVAGKPHLPWAGLPQQRPQEAPGKSFSRWPLMASSVVATEAEWHGEACGPRSWSLPRPTGRPGKPSHTRAFRRSPCVAQERVFCNRGKSRGGTILRFTRGRESDSFWEWRLPTSTAFRTPNSKIWC
jgi:hypothetical protein